MSSRSSDRGADERWTVRDACGPSASGVTRVRVPHPPRHSGRGPGCLERAGSGHPKRDPAHDHAGTSAASPAVLRRGRGQCHRVRRGSGGTRDSNADLGHGAEPRSGQPTAAHPDALGHWLPSPPHDGGPTLRPGPGEDRPGHERFQDRQPPPNCSPPCRTLNSPRTAASFSVAPPRPPLRCWPSRMSAEGRLTSVPGYAQESGWG